jgi:hypothetical protein
MIALVTIVVILLAAGAAYVALRARAAARVPLRATPAVPRPPAGVRRPAGASAAVWPAGGESRAAAGGPVIDSGAHAQLSGSEVAANAADEPPAPERRTEPEVVTGASVAHDLPATAPPEAEIGWALAFDSRSGRLDDTGRLRLIGDLGVIAQEWCVPLLARAYTEERRPGHRRAALTALAACNSRTAIPTYRAALASEDDQERAIATDALADLEPPLAPKRSLTVERR